MSRRLSGRWWRRREQVEQPGRREFRALLDPLERRVCRESPDRRECRERLGRKVRRVRKA